MRMYHRVSLYNVPHITFYTLKLPLYVFYYLKSRVLKTENHFPEIMSLLNVLRVECANYDKVDERGKHSLKCYYCYDEKCIYVKLRFYKKVNEEEYANFRNSVDIHCDYGISNLSVKNGYFHFVIYMRTEPIYSYEIDNYKMSVGTYYKGLYYWQFSKYPHMLAIGDTGQGKSVFIRYILNSLFSAQFDVWCVDGKKIDYANDEYRFTRYVANDVIKTSVIELLYDFRDEMQVRYDQMRKNGIRNYYEDQNLKPVFLLIDEYLTIVETAEKKELTEIKKLISEIIWLGRAAGYFLIITMQRADAKYIDGAIRDNFACRIVVGKASKESYMMIFNKNVKGFEIGRAWLQINNDMEIISIPHYKEFE